MSSTIPFRAQHTTTGHWHTLNCDLDNQVFTLTVEGRTHRVALGCTLWQGAPVRSFSSFLPKTRESNTLWFQLRDRQLYLASSPPVEAEETYSLEKHAPEWRTIRPGLSVAGTCTETTCTIRGAPVCVPFGLGFFNLEEAQASAYCPECTNALPTITSWILWDCIFTIPAGESHAPQEKALSFSREVVANWRWIETRTKVMGCAIL